ncbi:MAG: helix-turn-helix domain-containing protein [Thermoanaerobaculia bacterium]
MVEKLSDQDVGQAIEILLKRSSLRTQIALAEAVDLERSKVSRILSGSQSLTPAELSAISRALGVLEQEVIDLARRISGSEGAAVAEVGTKYSSGIDERRLDLLEQRLAEVKARVNDQIAELRHLILEGIYNGQLEGPHPKKKRSETGLALEDPEGEVAE